MEVTDNVRRRFEAAKRSGLADQDYLCSSANTANVWLRGRRGRLAEMASREPPIGGRLVPPGLAGCGRYLTLHFTVE